MKKLLLLTLSSLFFLSIASETLTNDDINIAHTEKMEKRLTELNNMLEEKAKEREEKAKLRELRLQKLDDALKEKAKQREESDGGHNSSEIHKALEKPEMQKSVTVIEKDSVQKVKVIEKVPVEENVKVIEEKSKMQENVIIIEETPVTEKEKS